MTRPQRRLPDPVFRLLVVVALLAAGVFALRSVIPPSLRTPELQVAEAEQREASRDIRYAGAPACAECHDAQYSLKKEGYHRNISCETCHGPATAHVANPVDIKPPAPRDRKFCPTCHAYNLSRPLGFPQINPVTHNPLQPCITCHEPHDPKPPTVPGECAACHGEVERTKALSPHVLLDCTTCHTAPEGHKITPRSVRPTKPTSRDFCGQCHKTDSDVPNVPKVDIATHGEKYLCWQCHFPHMPEVER
jgi:hypothetical protein